MPKDREFYDDEDPWDLHDENSTHGEQLELPLQYSSGDPKVTVSNSIKGTNWRVTGSSTAASTSNSDLLLVVQEQFQQIMDRIDALEDSLTGD